MPAPSASYVNSPPLLVNTNDDGPERADYDLLLIWRQRHAGYNHDFAIWLLRRSRDCEAKKEMVLR